MPEVYRVTPFPMSVPALQVIDSRRLITPRNQTASSSLPWRRTLKFFAASTRASRLKGGVRNLSARALFWNSRTISGDSWIPLRERIRPLSILIRFGRIPHVRNRPPRRGDYEVLAPSEMGENGLFYYLQLRQRDPLVGVLGNLAEIR